MTKMLAIALNELRVQLRQPATLVMMVLLPAALIFVIGLANGQGLGGGTASRTIIVDVLDHDNSADSAALLTSMRALDSALVLCPMDDGKPLNTEDETAKCNYAEGQTTLTEADYAARLTNEDSAAYLEIPAGFGAALLASEEVTLIYRSSDDTPGDSPVLQAVSAAVQRVAGVSVARRLAVNIAAETMNGDTGYVDAVNTQASNLWAANPIGVDFQTAPNDNSSQTAPGFQQSVPGMGSMYVMSTIFAGAVILLSERKTMTLQRLATMPVTASEIIGGKLLARFILGMVQYGIAFGVGIILGQFSGVSFGNNPLALVFVAASFTLCMSGLTLLFATLIKTDEQAASLATLLSLTLAPIGGAWWSLEMEFIPDFMRTISYLSPFRYAMDGFLSVIRHDGGFAEILPSCAVLLAAGGVFFFFAVRRFKVA
jgi:ABC-2 type transport system permease protein